MIPALIVPILAKPELLYDMVASIDYKVDHLLIIDNGQCVDRERVETCRAIQITVLDMPNNLGVAGSWNLGIKALPFAPYWLIANFDVTFPEGALEEFHRKMQDYAGLMLSAGSPPWCLFGLSAHAVRQVGLFDERFHPAYFEDNDYEDRCNAAGIPVVGSGIWVEHANSSTLTAGYQHVNVATFTKNQHLYMQKRDRGDLTEGAWSLQRRLDQSWD